MDPECPRLAPAERPVSRMEVRVCSMARSCSPCSPRRPSGDISGWEPATALSIPGPHVGVFCRMHRGSPSSPLAQLRSPLDPINICLHLPNLLGADSLPRLWPGRPGTLPKWTVPRLKDSCTLGVVCFVLTFVHPFPHLEIPTGFSRRSPKKTTVPQTPCGNARGPTRQAHPASREPVSWAGTRDPVLRWLVCSLLR